MNLLLIYLKRVEKGQVQHSYNILLFRYRRLGRPWTPLINEFTKLKQVASNEAGQTHTLIERKATNSQIFLFFL